MLKEESISVKRNNWARVCDTCRSAACTVYCRADSAYLCTSCDARIHTANKLSSRHERVWVCEACERAPAAFICKADAASLCTTCDADIHSANPLARRHHRVPVMPIPSSLYGPQAADQGSMMSMGADTEGGFLSQEAEDTLDEEEEDEAASWLLFNPPAKNSQNQNCTNGFFLGGEGVDEYLDLVEYNSSQDNQFSSDHVQYNNHQFKNDQQQQCYTVPHKSYGGETDSVVPVQCVKAKNHQLSQQKFQTGMEYETTNTGYAYHASLSHSYGSIPVPAPISTVESMIAMKHSKA